MTERQQPITRADFFRKAVGAALALGTGAALNACRTPARASNAGDIVAIDRTELTVANDAISIKGVPEQVPTSTLATELTVANDAISIKGVPEQVSSSSLDIAKGPFTNVTGLGTESFIAEPGTLLVGPDYRFDEAGITLGEIDNSVKASKGHVEYFSPVNQQVFETDGPSYSNLPEGGYMFASAGQMNVAVNGIDIELPAREGHNYFLVVRGLHADGLQDSDLNNTAKFTDYVPGHIEVERYPAGNPGHTGGFISEGQFGQKADASHSGDTNCGAEGCSELTAVFVDANTGAYTIIDRKNGSPWQQVATNIVA